MSELDRQLRRLITNSPELVSDDAKAGLPTEREIEVTVTRSAGTDGAVVVMIDGDVLASEGGPGIRVLFNGDQLYGDTEYLPDGTERPATYVRCNAWVSDLRYEED